MVAFMANIEAIEITGITEIGKTELLDVARTGDAARFSPRLAQSREQQGGKNCDDRDYDKDNLSNILICCILVMTEKKRRRIE